MYYIYFPYAVLLSGFMLVECQKKQHPRWWALVVLFAPVTFPYFWFRSRKAQGMILFMVFLTTFSAVCASETYLYLKEKEANKYADLPPITRQTMRYSDTLKETTARLDRALVTLEQLSKVESQTKKLKQTIDFIDELRQIMAQNQAAIHQFVKFTTDYRTYFEKKKMTWVYQIQQFYTNPKVVRHYQSLNAYLNSFEALLKYTYVNFDRITKLKTREYLDNYDQYYLRYRRAVDAHNKFNVQRIEFQNRFLLKYPGVKPYLPGERQTETFRLWE